MKFLFITISSFFITLHSWAHNPNFYANKNLQRLYPQAFATQTEALPFHLEIEKSEPQVRQEMVKKIKTDAKLHKNILNFNSLTTNEQVQTLTSLFELEVEVLKITPPELIIDEHSIPGWAFFEFDYTKGGPGKVFLSLKKMKEVNDKTDFILLLMHETRHSAQFQKAFTSQDVLAQGYLASFEAQQELKNQGHKFSFCDFLLLLNEFEAFQFANYIYGSLTQFQAPINDMGTLASQYNELGQLRVNIIDVFSQDHSNPLDFFNQLQTLQFNELYE